MRYIGIDIIEIARIEKTIARWGENFLRRVYTDLELRLYRKKPSSLLRAINLNPWATRSLTASALPT